MTDENKREKPAAKNDGQNGELRRDFLRKATLGALTVPLVSACSQQSSQGSSMEDTEMQGVPQGLVRDEAEGSSLKVETLAEAEKVLGLDYTGAEREQMLGFVESQLESIASIRAQAMPNDLPPALTFDPRLPDSPQPPAQEVFTPAGDTMALPSTDTQIAFASTISLGRWLRDGSITSRRLTEIYLDRIERFGGELECFVTVTPELALSQADEADRLLAAGTDKGALHGIPYVMKDIIDTAGVRTSWGAEPYKDRIAENDATVTRLLRESGAVHLAKSTAGAIAYGDIWFGGVTRNPWNPKEGSSGSSAGSASASAAGLCAFSIGTETLGSIVSPSERCGTTGLRPTFGRVSRSGAMALCWSLDKIGPICRYAEDTAAVMSVINGYDASDPSSLRSNFAYDGTTDLSDLTIGYVPGWYEEADDVDKTALEAARSLGATMREVAWPDLPYGDLTTIVLAEAAAAFAELTLENRDDELTWQDDNAWPNSWRGVRFYSAVDYIQLDRLRRRVMREIGAVFEDIDVLIGPNFTGGALVATNFTGHPCLALKAGFADRPTRTIFGQPADESGDTFRVPRATSIWGPLFGENAVVRVGAALERELGVSGEHPAAFT